jgi:DNA-directed RNA polymerase specialized sigma24 family protein
VRLSEDEGKIWTLKRPYEGIVYRQLSVGDFVSETFIRVWHARDRLDLTTVKAYLLAIARNMFLDERRRARDVVRETVMTVTRDVVHVHLQRRAYHLRPVSRRAVTGV